MTLNRRLTAHSLAWPGISVTALAAVVLTGVLSGSALLVAGRTPGILPELSDVGSQGTGIALAAYLDAATFQRVAGSESDRVFFSSRQKRNKGWVGPSGLELQSADDVTRSLTLGFAGARSNARPQFLEADSAPLHLFTGGRQDAKARSVERFGRVVFEEVYPGIDVAYRFAGRDLEFDFIIRPGGDPQAIRVEASGDTILEVEGATGDVIAAAGAHSYRIKKPVAFQFPGGVRSEVPVDARIEDNALTFTVGQYDPRIDLTIDPLVTQFSSFIGTRTDAQYDSIRAIATDVQGNLYLAGQTQYDLQLLGETGFSLTTPASLHVPNPRSAANPCAFKCGYVVKLAPDMSVVYGALIPWLDIRGLAVDSAGSAYFTGVAELQDAFPATAGVFANDPTGQSFVMKLAPGGGAIVYAGLFVADEGRGIEVDASGNAYIVGLARSPGLPTTPGSLKPAYQATGAVANEDGFILKINSTGSTVLYGSYLGGTGKDSAYAVTLGAQDAAIVVGQTESSDFVGLPGPTGGGADAFLLKLSANGASVLAGQHLGGSASEYAADVAPDGQGGFLLCGATESANFPVSAGVVQERLIGSRNGWLMRVNADFSRVYSSYYGGSIIDGLVAVTVDAQGGAHAAGVAFSGDLLTTADAFQDVSAAVSGDFLVGVGSGFYPLSNEDIREGFVVSFSADGRTLNHASYLGGLLSEPRHFESYSFAGAIARTADGTLFVAGSTGSASFPVTDGGFRQGIGGIGDAFLVKLAPRNLWVTTPSLLPPGDVGKAYAQQLQATGGVPPYQWQVVGFRLPDGLSLGGDGALSGTMATTQTEQPGYQFTVKVTDALGAFAYKSLMLTPRYPGNPVCTTGACSLTVAAGQAFSFRLPFLARGIPPFQLLQFGAMPPGLAIDFNTAMMAGTPTTVGTYSFSLALRDATGLQRALNWTVTVTGTSLAGGNGGSGGGGGSGVIETVTPAPASPASSGGGGGGAMSLELAALALLLAIRRRKAPGRPTHG